MVCAKCNITMRRHCPIGEELVAAVRDRFGAWADFIARHGTESPSRREAYDEAKERYLLHVYGGIRR